MKGEEEPVAALLRKRVGLYVPEGALSVKFVDEEG